MINRLPALLPVLLSPLLLSACGTIGDARDSYNYSLYTASPAGIAEKQAREAQQAEEARIAREKEKQTCLTYQRDWRAAGYNAGSAGGHPQYYNTLLRECQAHNLTFSKPQWDAGYRQGLKDRYCVYETALYIGTEYAFDQMMAQCTPLLSARQQQNMQIFYQKGQIISQLKSELSEAKYDLSQPESRLRYGRDEEITREDRREYRSRQREVSDLQYELELMHSEAQRLLLQTGGG